MSARDAAETLTAAGKYSEVRAHVSQAAQDAAGRYRSIASDAALSEAGRNFRMANAYLRTLRGVEDHLGREAKKVGDINRADALNVIGVGGLKGDPSHLVVSRRDAGDRVAQVETRQELQELLRSATRTGDEVLARAVAERALSEQDDKTVNMFIADRPELEASVERLWNAERAKGVGLEFTIEMSNLKPAELASMPDWQIEQIAADDPTPGEAADAARAAYNRMPHNSEVFGHVTKSPPAYYNGDAEVGIGE